ncbi:MAG: FecR domain-containing protein, partial [Desulfatiglandales bacterium]
MKELFPRIFRHVGLRFAAVVMLITASGVLPLGAEMLTVTVQENQSLRDIAEEYLGNPNLWIDILRANSIESAADIKVGMQLRIPATALARANQALQEALGLIDKATMTGARLFAPSIIANAIETRDRAIAERNIGRYDSSYNLARQSGEKAHEALIICIANQNVPAQAIINYRKGTVQRREPESRIWNNASLNTILLEGERVRTLSESYASILFRDESRLRLEENSLALIQRMRSNRLANIEDSSIRLLEGDLSVFLGGSRSLNNFHLEIPDIETIVRSSRFWVSRDE